jgi:type II secretory pathway predicted ATPase ExeA/septal ring-binding cell division protein DamX
MYLQHFGLRESPFRITPHTEFFFAGANRGSTLEALIYAITHDEGIVKVTGEVGSGKTMLCRMLLEKLPEQVETVYLANPSLSRDEILYAIADELQAPLPEGRTHLLLRSLQERLLEIYAAGRQVVVLIDEAHAMPPETLEEIRLLSNLESKRHKLLQIVLFGQPELDHRLSDMSMRQLKERITHNFALEPLRRHDLPGYLMYRIRAAGYHGPDLFTPRAIQLISQASEGLTRRINILADKALLSAFSEGTHQIDHKQVKAAIRDAQFKPMQGGNAQWTRGRIGAAAAAAIMTIAGTAYVAGSHNASNSQGSPGSLASVTSSKPPPTPAPTVEMTNTTAPAPAPAPTPETVSPAPLPASEPPPGAAMTPDTPIAPPPAQSTGVTEPTTQTSPSIAEHIAVTDEWLKKTPDTHYFIQLLNTDTANQRKVEFFVESINKLLDPRQLRIYRSTLSGRDKLGVIYGDYPTREAANAALSRLPGTIRTSRPYVRPVSKLR